MDSASNYDIALTAEFVRSRGFTRVALQFPDELLKDSPAVARALRTELGGGVRVYVMADAAYGSCCVDEIAASHVNAQCVIHYGHACMSPTSNLPALFVFGKASTDVNACAKAICQCASTSEKPVMVLYGLEYVHALQRIKEEVVDISRHNDLKAMVQYAEVTSTVIEPLEVSKEDKLWTESNDGANSNAVHLRQQGENATVPVAADGNKVGASTRYSLGGLTWNVPPGRKMEDYLVFWIGSENSSFANIVLTFNNCDIVRYDAQENQLLKDFSHENRILKRRYYLVEKAKDANIVGILVGTLGVAGYLRIIGQMKELIEGAGKKAYALVMGRPNAVKLANFPECDVFVYVSCAQTALLDSKELLAPVITPFEAVLAFGRGKQWTGEYVMEFQNLMALSPSGSIGMAEEARFSFIHGGYVEDVQQDNVAESTEDSLALAEMAEKALKLRYQFSDSVLLKGEAKSGAEFLAARSYQGLFPDYENANPESYIVGRTGRAAGYKHEKSRKS